MCDPNETESLLEALFADPEWLRLLVILLGSILGFFGATAGRHYFDRKLDRERRAADARALAAELHAEIMWFRGNLSCRIDYLTEQLDGAVGDHVETDETLFVMMRYPPLTVLHGHIGKLGDLSFLAVRSLLTIDREVKTAEFYEQLARSWQTDKGIPTNAIEAVIEQFKTIKGQAIRCELVLGGAAGLSDRERGLNHFQEE